jgi:hypothetical protein
MKEAAEAERKARLEAEYQAALEKQRAEQQARVERAKLEWEELIRTLPEELDRLEEIVTKELIPEWKQSANAPIDWDRIEDPACSTKWELRFNDYERLEENIYYQYESSDGRRGGYDSERVVREKMPGSYWVNPHSSKEHFISRASSPDGPIPPIKYPHCTIAGELDLWKEYPHDKARVDNILKKMEEDRAYYRARVDEAKAALAGTAQERAKYLLSQREGDQIRNALKRVWRTLNPDKTETKFWEDILQVLQ